MKYSDILKDNLANSPLIRHIFNRLNKPITVETTDIRIMGILRSIDVVQKFIEVEAFSPSENTYFVNLRHIIWIKAEKYLETR